MTDDNEPRPLKRFPTGLAGLDTVLNGGLVGGGIYMVMGRPGSGKTILGNQICFNHVKTGGRALYVTVLTESHARLLSSLESMEFFDPQHLANSLVYLSGYQALGEHRLDGLLQLLRNGIRDQKASLLVIDGLVTSTVDETETKKFLHDLQVLTELVGCTTLLLTGAKGPDGNYAERTMVDGLLQLNSVRVGMRTVRELEVLKHRGSPTILGTHFFRISNAGITINPRTEAIHGSRAPLTALTGILPVGIPTLDAMFGGGLREGTTTLLLGAPGSGKTSLGLNFLAAGGKNHEPGLYWGFTEPPANVQKKSAHIAAPLAPHVERGDVELSWRAPVEQIADSLADELFEAIKRRKVRRLFIDGLEGFTSALLYEDRVASFMAALSNELRCLGVTTLAAIETTDILGGGFELPVAISPIVDNIVLMRYVELHAQLRRLISVIKMRDAKYDSSLREFTIGEKGITVAPTFASAEQIMSGMARPGPTPPRRTRKTAQRKSKSRLRGK